METSESNHPFMKKVGEPALASLEKVYLTLCHWQMRDLMEEKSLKDPVIIFRFCCCQLLLR